MASAHEERPNDAARWPLHARAFAACLHAVLAGLLVAAITLPREGLRDAVTLGAFAATAGFALFALERRGAGPGEVLLRLGGATAFAAVLGPLAGLWAKALAQRGPLAAYDRMASQLAGVLRHPGEALEKAAFIGLAAAAVAAAIAPALVVRAARRRLADQVGAGITGTVAALTVFALCLDDRHVTRFWPAFAEVTAGAAAYVVLVGGGVDRAARRLGLSPKAGPPATAAPATRLTGSLPWLALLLLAGAFADAVRHDHCCRGPNYESWAIGSLKTLVTSQAIARGSDRDGDGVPDYADSLAELGSLELIDPVLAGGRKYGYVFRVLRPAGDPGQFSWAAVAQPQRWGLAGERAFFTNHTGEIWFTSKPGAVVVTLPTCDPPPGMRSLWR